MCADSGDRGAGLKAKIATDRSRSASAYGYYIAEAEKKGRAMKKVLRGS